MTDITQRKLNRYAIRLPIRITISDEPPEKPGVEYATSDVSAGGAFVDTDSPMPLGAEIEIDLTVPLDDVAQVSGKSALIKITGEVIRVNTRGMAIRFGDRYEICPLQ